MLEVVSFCSLWQRFSVYTSALVLLLLFSSPGQAQTIQLLKDINVNPQKATIYRSCASSTHKFLTVGDPLNGIELWTTDGTSAGTRLLKDLTPGSDSTFERYFYSDTQFCTAAGNRIFFVTIQSELGVSDGTAAGTLILPGADYHLDTILAAINGRVFFNTWDDQIGVSDGTPAGTFLLPANYPYGGSHAALGDVLIFSGYTGPESYEPDLTLWRTDGTIAGTQALTSLTNGGSPSGLQTANGRVFFQASDAAHGTELWASDGTQAGTSLVKDILPGAEGSYPRGITAGSGGIMFRADTAIQGTEPWFSDGSDAGTHIVADLTPGVGGSGINKIIFTGSGYILFVSGNSVLGTTLYASDGTSLTSLGTFYEIESDSVRLRDSDGHMFFLAQETSSSPTFIWRTDGSVAGTEALDWTSGWINNETMRFAGNRLLFQEGNNGAPSVLWSTDGTQAGSTNLLEIAAVDDITLSSLGDSVLISLNHRFESGNWGWLNWVTDGSPAGTQVMDLMVDGANSSSRVGQIGKLGEVLLLSADDGVHGSELWRTDGTTAGTWLIKDIRAGASGSSPYGLVEGGGVYFFAADDGVHGAALWRTDGSADGTWLVKEIFPGGDGFAPDYDCGSGSEWEVATSQSPNTANFAVEMGGVVYFPACSEAYGRELWRSNGTAEGTYMVKDIAPGTLNAKLTDLLVFGDSLYFGADDEVSGLELWKSDGTTEGTLLFKDINPGPEDSEPTGFVEYSNAIFFKADDGTHGIEPWKSDGSAAGTVMLADYNNQLDYQGRNKGSMVEYNNGFEIAAGFLFVTLNDGVHGAEPWISDGTVQGTSLLADINTTSNGYPSGSSCSRGFYAFAGRILFTSEEYLCGYSDVLPSLWVTDGTPEGTQPFGLELKDAGDMIDTGSYLFFSAKAGNSQGSELYRSDGTPQGTAVVTDLYPGDIGSGPDIFHVLNGRLIFSARDPELNYEPRYLDLDEADMCPLDPAKFHPGVCGCGVADIDSDHDRRADCVDVCPADRSKSADAGVCGCGIADIDSDSDGTMDCQDLCLGSAKPAPGVCGCGLPDIDSDGDGAMDCQDQCPASSLKAAPGVCGCDIADIDLNGNQVVDCQESAESPALSSVTPRKARLKRKKNTALVTLTAREGVKYVVTYTISSLKKSKSKPKKKTLVVRKPALTIKKLKAGTKLSLSYKYQRLDAAAQVSKVSAVSKLSIKTIR